MQIVPKMHSKKKMFLQLQMLRTTTTATEKTTLQKIHTLLKHYRKTVLYVFRTLPYWGFGLMSLP